MTPGRNLPSLGTRFKEMLPCVSGNLGTQLLRQSAWQWRMLASEESLLVFLYVEKSTCIKRLRSALGMAAFP